tara:strand:+ start:1899 stop:2129 length:231 start_codon:yes stop_codon:yes gene_type:complete
MKTLEQLHIEEKELLIKKIKLNRFFTKYLDKFHHKMKSENTNTPIWDLYNTKMKEYEEIDYGIKTNAYYISKHRNV